MNLSSGSIRACAREGMVTREQLQSYVQLDKVTDYILEHQLWSTKIPMVPSLLSFPTDITNVTQELLSNTLSTYSNLPVTVDSFESQRIGVGKGWSGSVYHLSDIRYSGDNVDSLPSSMILKISAGLWLERTAANEADFYVKLGRQIWNIGIL